MYLKIHIYVSFLLYIPLYCNKRINEWTDEKKSNLCISSGRSKSKSKIKVENYFISFHFGRSEKTRTFVERETKAKKHNFYLSYLFRVSLKLINKIIERKKKEESWISTTNTITQNASQSGLTIKNVYFLSIFIRYITCLN